MDVTFEIFLGFDPDVSIVIRGHTLISYIGWYDMVGGIEKDISRISLHSMGVLER